MKGGIDVAIIGASGYTASELIRLLLLHDYVKIKYLVGNSTAGKKIEDIFSHFYGKNLPTIKKFNEIDFSEVDLVFSCLPHGESHKIFKKIPSYIKIIDLSADFRLKNLALYKEYYNVDHACADLTKDAVYGLTELYREQIKDAKIVACPGCYPTAILLALLPLLKNKYITNEYIVADAKSGVSGAGRSLKQSNLFCEINENVIPYGIAKHRHLAEIMENIANFSDKKLAIEFLPHVIPVSRGEIVTMYFESNASAENLKRYLSDFYKDEYFVRILDNAKIPNIKNVNNTNFCDINIFDSQIKNKIIVISAIDNLTKGSSGQAIQNMNLIFGFPEETGLLHNPIFP
jgi:N-acetyl-gamma-glutamyl-phosphate reductase